MLFPSQPFSALTLVCPYIPLPMLPCPYFIALDPTNVPSTQNLTPSFPESVSPYLIPLNPPYLTIPALDPTIVLFILTLTFTFASPTLI